MSFLPILIEMESMPCLVAGGGAIALHNVKKFLEHGADVTVVAPEVCTEIQKLSVKIFRRCAEASDCDGMALVADATGNRDAEELLSKTCARLHIPYICAGRGELCTAILPAVYSSGRTMIAVSSNGASPAASVWLRDFLAEKIPENTDAILDRMADVRRTAKDSLDSQPVRREFMRCCLKKMTDTGKIISDTDIIEILNGYLKEETK